jgi:hypothetical protein
LAPLPLWRTCIASAPRASAPRVSRSSDANRGTVADGSPF